MPFQSSSAYEVVRSLSFPRLVNTDGNRKAAEQIASAFRAHKLEVEVEDFAFSRFPAEMATRLLLGFYAGLAVLSLFLFPISSWASVAVSAGALLLIILTSRWHKLFEKLYDLGKKGIKQVTTRNIIAQKWHKLSEKLYNITKKQVTARNVIARKRSSSKADLNIVFIAHYDSKSQLLALGYRISLVGLAILSFSAYTFTIAALTIRSEMYNLSNLSNLILFLNFSVLLATAILEFNFTSNKSDGTLDNASGVGALLELSRIFSRLRFRHLNLTFVATDAEEMGMAGALRFIQRHQPEFDPHSSLFINYDSVGKAGKFLIISKRPILSYFQTKMGPDLSKLLLRAAKRSHIKVRMAHLIFGVGFDHLPIAVRGYEAVTLTSGRLSSVFKFHTKGDNIFQVEEDALGQAGQVGYELVMQLELEARRERLMRR